VGLDVDLVARRIEQRTAGVLQFNLASL